MRSTIAVLCLLFAASAVRAQQPNQSPVQPYRGVVQGSFADVVKKQAEMMRINIGMNFMLTGVTDPIGDDAKLRDRTRRQVYQMAVKECELLLEMIANECRIETINININRNPQVSESVNVNANIALRAVQKQPGQ
jgi:hypothetical protein